jgi:hypothetical protein
VLTPQAQVVLLLALAGALLSVLGYRIRYRREWHLIAGFRFDILRDPEGFGRWVGSIGILLGSVSFGAAALALTRPDLNGLLGTAYAAAFLGGTALLAVGCLRYIL